MKFEHKTAKMHYIYYDQAQKKAIHGYNDVGVSMTAEFDENALPYNGTSPYSGEIDSIMKSIEMSFVGETYIRGHLLNEHLGGVGRWFNLFPITAKANKEHELKVEHCVKEDTGIINNTLKRKQDGSKPIKNNLIKKYIVDIQPDEKELSTLNPNCTINCSVEYFNSSKQNRIFDPIESKSSVVNTLYNFINNFEDGIDVVQQTKTIPCNNEKNTRLQKRKIIYDISDISQVDKFTAFTGSDFEIQRKNKILNKFFEISQCIIANKLQYSIDQRRDIYKKTAQLLNGLKPQNDSNV